MLISHGVLEEILFTAIISDFYLFLAWLWEAILWYEGVFFDSGFAWTSFTLPVF